MSELFKPPFHFKAALRGNVGHYRWFHKNYNIHRLTGDIKEESYLNNSNSGARSPRSALF